MTKKSDKKSRLKKAEGTKTQNKTQKIHVKPKSLV